MRLILCCLIVALVSCNREKTIHTPSGLKYVVHREHKKENEGKKPVVGDYVTLEMVYKNDKDSVLFDSRKEHRPLRFALRPSSFAGSFEEGLTYLCPGDSVTFYVSSDSLFAKVINADLDKKKGEAPAKNPSPGKFFKFEVSLLKVQSYLEAEMEMAMEESRQEAAERNALEKYIAEKNITAKPDSEGYYLLIDSAGKGPAIENGSTVYLNFISRFLNGFAFDSNLNTGKPFSFTVGQNEVVKGWELAMIKMREGDRATIILPSKLAYGSEGIKRPGTLQYVVPPYSALVLDVKIVKVDKPVSKK